MRHYKIWADKLRGATSTQYQFMVSVFINFVAKGTQLHPVKWLCFSVLRDSGLVSSVYVFCCWTLVLEEVLN